jgi:two-component system NtrC family response regulator
MTDKTDLKVLLVVEDDKRSQRQLKWAYEGYEVVCAGDRKGAIEALRVHVNPRSSHSISVFRPIPTGRKRAATLAEILRPSPMPRLSSQAGTAPARARSRQSPWVPTISTRSRSTSTILG